jgi:Tol biopolymer transport system component
MKVARVVIAVAGVALAANAQVERVSVGPAGVEANQDSAFVGGVARDGQRVVFVSTATNLVAGDTNGVQDVFLRDLAANATVRLSANAGGTQANLACGAPTLSADGQWSAFSSRATNLVPADANGLEDVFLKHVASGAVVLASVDSFGAAGNGSSRMPSLSADGRYVAFASLASNLVPGDTNATWDVFVHDRVTGATVRASVDSLGVEGNAESSAPALAGCGCCVAFTSSASNLVTVDTNLSSDVFVHDLASGTTTCASLGLGGIPAFLGAQRAFLSADASLVGFDSASNDLVAGDTNLANDVFVLERWNGTLTRASVATGGGEGDHMSLAGALSGDGRFVTFTSLASNLVPGDTNLKQDVFVHERATGQTTRVSQSAGGNEGNQSSSGSALSFDGRFVVFSSYASNLVASDTNGVGDVFRVDRGPQPNGAPLSFCTPGTSSNGCTALLSASAQPSLSGANPCLLLATGVEGQRAGLFFYGLDNSCFVPIPWGASSSWLCVRAPLQRTPLASSGGTNGACDGTLALDWASFAASHPNALGQPWNVGDRAFVQAWYRDPPSPKTTTLSDALLLTYEP